MSSAETRPTARTSVPPASFPFKAETVPVSSASAMALPSSNTPALDQYRLQLYNYAMAERLRFAGHPFMAPYANQMAAAAALSAQINRSSVPTSSPQQELNPFFLTYAAAKFQQPQQPTPSDPRLFHQHQNGNVIRPGMVMMEEPKPQHSYIGLIAMAILSSAEKKLVLSDIYQYILDNYAYFRTRGPGWRNSIRHNLSLNDCFIKAGRSANGKGHYWAIHPANIEDFKKGDFRRRKAQRKVRKHMGLAVDEEDSPTPPPSPVSAHQMAASLAGWPFGAHPLPGVDHQRNLMMEHHQSLLMMAAAAAASAGPSMTSLSPSVSSDDGQHQANPPAAPKKRLFDVASLLGRDSEAPENSKTTEEDERSSGAGSSQSHREEKRIKLEADEEVDVVSDDSEDEQLRNLAGRDSPVHQEPEKSSLIETVHHQPIAAGLWRLPQPTLRFNQRLGNPATLFPAPIPPSPEQLAKYYEQVAEAMRNNCLRAPEHKSKQS